MNLNKLSQAIAEIDESFKEKSSLLANRISTFLSCIREEDIEALKQRELISGDMFFDIIHEELLDIIKSELNLTLDQVAELTDSLMRLTDLVSLVYEYPNKKLLLTALEIID